MKIIGVSDIHIRNLRRMDEYNEQLSKFIDECKKIAEENGAENTRIVVAGDLVHNKTELSPECYTVASWFLKQLDNICKTIVIAGNHDITTNQSRLDPISTIFSMCNFKQTYYLDKDLGYQSGCIADEDIVWCLYSAFDNFSKPNIEEYKISYPNSKYIGLFHGNVKSAKTDAGYLVENGLDASCFELLDFCIMGHIHKRQEIKYEGVPLVYCGSLIQQDHGENISSHGYIVYDTDTEEYIINDITNENHCFYTFTINNENDIDDDLEEIINL